MHRPFWFVVGGLMVAASAWGTWARVARAADEVAGNLIQFNDNGGWCWYQDERAIVDRVAGTLLVASVATSAGPGGEARRGDIDVVSYELASGRRRRVTLHEKFQEDDHDVPALLLRPDGRYLSMYTKHNHDKLTLYRVSTRPHDATDWNEEQRFDWTSHADFNATYSNLFHLSAENRTYNFVRAGNRGPNILLSTDQGSTWKYAGKLLFNPIYVGYVNGYLKYASNGVDRIDFVATEHHPRNYNTSMYHGYIRHGKMHRSDGTLVDDDVFDDRAPNQTSLTKVFAADAVFGGERMTRAWPCDLQRGADGHPHFVFSTRANDEPENTRGYNDHRFFYARYDGERWRVDPLAKAGARLYPREQDYTGLVALHPDDPQTLFVSTPIDPRDGTATPHHEIYRGATHDGGSSWNWTPQTRNSSVDNLRPIVPSWAADRTVLLWLRGTYHSMHEYNTAVVGLVEAHGQTSGKRSPAGGDSTPP